MSSDVKKEKKVLVGVVLANRRSILDLKRIEEDPDRRHHHTHIVKDGRGLEEAAEAEEEVDQNQSPSIIEHNTGMTQVRDDGRPGWGSSTDKKCRSDKESK